MAATAPTKPTSSGVGESVPVGSVVVAVVVIVVPVGGVVVVVLDSTINDAVSESPLLQDTVTVRLSLALAETLNVSYIPQLNDWFS